MSLVRRIDLKEMPEIYIFYCSRCQHAETVKQERTVCEASGRELVGADWASNPCEAAPAARR
jgi:hypothetical protein